MTPERLRELREYAEQYHELAFSGVGMDCNHRLLTRALRESLDEIEWMQTAIAELQQRLKQRAAEHAAAVADPFLVLP